MKVKICSVCGKERKLWRSKPLTCIYCKNTHGQKSGDIKSKNTSKSLKTNIFVMGQKPRAEQGDRANGRMRVPSHSKKVPSSKYRRAGVVIKKRKPPRKSIPESIAWGKQRVRYYKEAIIDNQSRNEEKVHCDECSAVLLQEKGHPGRNVCHIVPWRSTYLDKRNHFILGKGELFGQCRCGILFDDEGGKEKMKIYPRYVEIKTVLTLEYYSR